MIIAAKRAKQLLAGAKPLIKSKSKNLIRIAQEEIKRGLVDFEIVDGEMEEAEEIPDFTEEALIGEEITSGVDDKPEDKGEKKKKPEKSDES